MPRPERRVCRNQRLSLQREMLYDVNQPDRMSFWPANHRRVIIIVIIFGRRGLRSVGLLPFVCVDSKEDFVWTVER